MWSLSSNIRSKLSPPPSNSEKYTSFYNNSSSRTVDKDENDDKLYRKLQNRLFNEKRSLRLGRLFMKKKKGGLAHEQNDSSSTKQVFYSGIVHSIDRFCTKTQNCIYQFCCCVGGDDNDEKSTVIITKTHHFLAWEEVGEEDELAFLREPAGYVSFVNTDYNDGTFPLLPNDELHLDFSHDATDYDIINGDCHDCTTDRSISLPGDDDRHDSNGTDGEEIGLNPYFAHLSIPSSLTMSSTASDEKGDGKHASKTQDYGPSVQKRPSRWLGAVERNLKSLLNMKIISMNTEPTSSWISSLD